MKMRYLLMAAFIGCTFGPPVDTCPGVCWTYTQTIADVEPDGDFDSTCLNLNGNPLTVAIPASGDMTGRTCVTNPVHLGMRAVIGSVNHNGDLSESSTQEESDYTNATNDISTDLQTVCRAYLLGEGCAIGCNDPMTCTQQEQDTWDAWNAICDDFLVDPSQVAMHDTTGCAGWDPPVEDTIDTIEVSDPDECFSLDTGGGDDLGNPPTMCSGDGEAGGAVDETGAMSDPPWGDLDNLITCSPSTTCTIEEELLQNVETNFEVFHDEDVILEMVSLASGTIVGAQISGLGSGEDSYNLLHTYLGVNNDDVITHVNSVALDSEAHVFDVLNGIPLQSGWSITVRRYNHGTGNWLTRSYSVSFPVSSP